MKEINIARTIINKRKEKGLTQDELMAPLALTIVLPSIIVFVTVLVPESTSDFQRLLAMLPDTAGEYNQKQMILGLVLNKIMPAFFLLIPVMASSVMAANSFVGEKEKHTLETLLYSPLSLKQLFQSQMLAGFSVGMLVSYISFAAMIDVLLMREAAGRFTYEKLLK